MSLFNIKQLQVKVFLPNIYTALSSVKETIVILLLRTFCFSLDLVRDILKSINFPFLWRSFSMTLYSREIILKTHSHIYKKTKDVDSCMPSKFRYQSPTEHESLIVTAKLLNIVSHDDKNHFLNFKLDFSKTHLVCEQSSKLTKNFLWDKLLKYLKYLLARRPQILPKLVARPKKVLAPGVGLVDFLSPVPKHIKEIVKVKKISEKVASRPTSTKRIFSQTRTRTLWKYLRNPKLIFT